MTKFKNDLSVIGVDESGRGAIAGPITVGAVILSGEENLSSIKDCKKIRSRAQREEIARDIMENSLAWSVGIVESVDIDAVGTSSAVCLAICRALKMMPLRDHVVVIDGALHVPKYADAQHLIIKADSRVKAVSAASILARVVHDKIMLELDLEFPSYGFESNMGYFSKEHHLVLGEKGPCSAHRYSFKPVRQAMKY